MKLLGILLIVFSVLGCQVEYAESDGVLADGTVVIESNEVLDFNAEEGRLKLLNDYSKRRSGKGKDSTWGKV